MDFLSFIKERKNLLLLISLGINILLVIGLGIICYFKFYKNADNDNLANIIPESNSEIVTTINEDNEESSQFYVEVKGAVQNPGVFEVANKSIINDLINLAGGFKSNAYTKNINLSRQVTKEMVLYVYTTSEYKKLNTSNEVVQNVCECPTYDISSCLDNAQSEIVTNNEENNNSNNQTAIPNNNSNNADDLNDSTNSSTSENKAKVNINTASKSELMQISGVGEAKADKIIEYRNTNGRFQNIDEIKNVSGIGDAMFEKIRDYITV